MTILAWLLPALGVGGLGALTYFVGPAAMLTGAKAVFGVLAKIPWQVYVIAALAIAFAYLVHDRNKWKDRAASYNAEAVADWNAAKSAIGNPRLDRKDTAKQIAALGVDLKTSIANEATLRTQVKTEADSIQAAHDEAAAEHAAAVKAKNLAAEHDAEADAVISRLQASTRSSAGKSASTAICQPNDTVNSQWRQQ